MTFSRTTKSCETIRGPEKPGNLLKLRDVFVKQLGISVFGTVICYAVCTFDLKNFSVCCVTKELLLILSLAKLFLEKLSRLLEKTWKFVSKKGFEPCSGRAREDYFNLMHMV